MYICAYINMFVFICIYLHTYIQLYIHIDTYIDFSVHPTKPSPAGSGIFHFEYCI